MHIALLADIRSEPVSPGAPPYLPVLARCVTRGDPLGFASPTFEGCLLDDFGIRPEEAPLAAIALAGEGDDPGSAYWLRADPVTLHPTLHRIAGRRLQPGELDWSEAQALAGALSEHLRADGCELTVKHPLRWYVRSPPQHLRTQPLSVTLNPLDETLMPTGPDAARWQRLMTEAQMLLHATDINTAREAAGRAPVNGIWCWGAGKIDALPLRRYTQVFCDDVVGLGLGRLSGATDVLKAEDAAATLAKSRPNGSGEILIAVSGAQSRSPEAFESNWLAPLVALVENGTALRLDLRLWLGPHTIGRRLTRKALRRWWRRTQSLARRA